MDTLEPGRYYQLGNKTYWLILFEKTLPVVVLFILGFAIPFFPENKLFNIFPNIINSISIYIFLLAIVMLVVSIAIAFIEYETSRVMMDNATVHIVRGILSKHEISIPYRRIQSVEIKQSLLFRLLGVGRVVISTTTDIDQDSSSFDNNYNDEVIRTMDYPLACLVEKTLTNRAEIERIEIKKGLIDKVA